MSRAVGMGFQAEGSTCKDPGAGPGRRQEQSGCHRASSEVRHSEACQPPSSSFPEEVLASVLRPKGPFSSEVGEEGVDVCGPWGWGAGHSRGRQKWLILTHSIKNLS